MQWYLNLLMGNIQHNRIKLAKAEYALVSITDLIHACGGAISAISSVRPWRNW